MPTTKAMLVAARLSSRADAESAQPLPCTGPEPYIGQALLLFVGRLTLFAGAALSLAAHTAATGPVRTVPVKGGTHHFPSHCLLRRYLGSNALTQLNANIFNGLSQLTTL